MPLRVTSIALADSYMKNFVRLNMGKALKMNY